MICDSCYILGIKFTGYEYLNLVDFIWVALKKKDYGRILDYERNFFREYAKKSGLSTKMVCAVRRFEK